MVETTDDDRSLDFDTFYRREALHLAALAASLVGDHERGAELAHEAMLRAFRSWQKVGNLERPGAWARRVTINLAIDATRRRRRERRAVERVTSEEAVGASEPTEAGFWLAVRELPERQRVAVALRYIDDMSVEEIAEVMSISEGTVKSSLFTARRALAARLHAEEVSDADDR